jgi:hypothetical protein
MTPADVFLSRLDGPKPLAAGRWAARWVARCPAHADKDPSLYVAEAPDSRLLVHCHAGCPTLDIVQAVGLDLKDLFPREENYKSFFPKPRKRHDEDEFFLLVCAGARERGEKLTSLDLQKERAAFLRIAAKA